MVGRRLPRSPRDGSAASRCGGRGDGGLPRGGESSQRILRGAVPARVTVHVQRDDALCRIPLVGGECRGASAVAAVVRPAAGRARTDEEDEQHDDVVRHRAQAGGPSRAPGLELGRNGTRDFVAPLHGLLEQPAVSGNAGTSWLAQRLSISSRTLRAGTTGPGVMSPPLSYSVGVSGSPPDMKYEELLVKLYTSTATDWEKVELHPLREFDEDGRPHFYSGLAVNRDDARVTLGWGGDVREAPTSADIPGWPANEAWVKKGNFPNGSASMFTVHLRLNGEVVREWAMAWLDGYRYAVPLPRYSSEDTTKFEVSANDRLVGNLILKLASPGGYGGRTTVEQLLERCGVLMPK